MKAIYRCLPLILAISLNACATAKPPLDSAKQIVLIAPGIDMELPNLKEAKSSVEATQLVTAHYGKETFVFQSQISITPERCLIVGLDQMGGVLIKITWTKNGIDYQKAPWLPAQLRPENILADIILINWPGKTVQKSLIGKNVKLIITHDSRSVTLNDQEILRVDYRYNKTPWSGKMRYHNFPWKYDLDIQSVKQN